MNENPIHALQEKKGVDIFTRSSCVCTRGSGVCSGQDTRAIWLGECILLHRTHIGNMLSETIKFCPPVRGGNDLQEQVVVSAGRVHAQAKRAAKAQLRDDAVKLLMERESNPKETCQEIKYPNFPNYTSGHRDHLLQWEPTIMLLETYWSAWGWGNLNCIIYF